MLPEKEIAKEQDLQIIRGKTNVLRKRPISSTDLRDARREGVQEILYFQRKHEGSNAEDKGGRGKEEKGTARRQVLFSSR